MDQYQGLDIQPGESSCLDSPCMPDTLGMSSDPFDLSNIDPQLLSLSTTSSAQPASDTAYLGDMSENSHESLAISDEGSIETPIQIGSMCNRLPPSGDQNDDRRDSVYPTPPSRVVDYSMDLARSLEGGGNEISETGSHCTYCRGILKLTNLSQKTI